MIRSILLLLIIIQCGSFSHNASAQTVGYDAAGRVSQIVYDNGTVTRYKYDKAGNLKKALVNPAATASISAGELSGNSIRFKVQRTGDLSQSLIVGLAAEGDAVSGGDYVSVPKSVIIPANESSVEFSVNLRSDRPASSEKKLVVHLAEGDNYALNDKFSATITLPEKK